MTAADGVQDEDGRRTVRAATRGSMLFTRTGANISENEGCSTLKFAFALQRTWVRGPEVPADLLGEDFLTPEDHRDITLDHIERTSDIISKVEIRLIAAA